MIAKYPIIIATHGNNLPVIVGLYRNWLKIGFEWSNVIVITNDENINRIDLGNWKKVLVHKSDWRTEWREAIRKIQAKGILKALWYLDDFYLNSCPNNDDLIASFAIDCNYLRLTPYERPLIKRNFLSDRHGYEMVPLKHPYYCSLQAAIWDLDYLDTKLISANNIWAFENQEGEGHLAVRKKVMKYRHSVEKGRWKWYSQIIYKKELEGLFNLKERENLLSFATLMDIARHVKFTIFGY